MMQGRDTMDERPASIEERNLSKAESLLKSAGLIMPPVPEELIARFRERSSWCFSTRLLSVSPYNIKQYVQEALSGRVQDSLILARAGHGVNTYAMHYFLVHGPLQLFLQISWGGANMDSRQTTAEVNKCFRLVERLLESVGEGLRSGRLRPADRLTVVASNVYGGFWLAPTENGPTQTAAARWDGSARDPKIVLIEAIRWLTQTHTSVRPVIRISKSQYISGLQCRKLLWWMVHEPESPELAVGEELQVIFERGRRVGELARTCVPGGVLVGLPHHEVTHRLAATAQAIADKAPVVYEASFLEDGIFVAVDILQRRRDGFVMAEVKSTLDVKNDHIPDVAVQAHVVRRAGLTVKSAEVMHLNRECRYPDLSNLFVRENVTSVIRSAVRAVPKQAGELVSMLAGPLPEVKTGPHCTTPHACPFIERCWPPLPAHHVSSLYGIRKAKAEEFVADGYNTLFDLPRKFAASPAARRQIHSVRTGEMIVERDLRGALASLTPPIAFLDFETVNPAIPVWPGCRPYAQVPVQFSCHVLKADGVEHHAWLAEGPDDPREQFARALIAACAGVNTVLAYNAPFERQCIDGLIEALPHVEDDLVALSSRIRDLLPIVRDHVYHPDFGGSFSIKKVLPALVPGLGYDDLKIQDGRSAAAAIETLLLGADALTAAQQRSLRRDLLRYCERDTLGMVRLYERLLKLAGMGR
ncbi:hypothetical protein CLG94_07085 [Candidatus Methylomirabilis limnetica]|uniref:DUF2779 domain-containing protein n=2 Tax=Candidatus Methylomirabilis limnetica TaxID=2033718 RepID=A0A2T4TXW8_9BACT|nr:hypothetical protein CLG94_07085 [Candidatus Methylomirabilis limnetica]